MFVTQVLGNQNLRTSSNSSIGSVTTPLHCRLPHPLPLIRWRKIRVAMYQLPFITKPPVDMRHANGHRLLRATIKMSSPRSKPTV